MTTVIEVTDISKRYKIRHTDTLDSNSIGESITRHIRHRLHTISPFHTPYLTSRDFWALQNISFSVKQGEKVAVIGHNGSGKTSLFRILSRITMPTSGSATIRGRVTSLLQAGTGFHPELSGRENVYMNGVILGMSRQEVTKKFDEIVAFSGVEEFLDVPLKHYSTGMQARLGFSVAAHLDAQIMLIDEGLASGDSEFRQKCMVKIRELSEKGHTIMFASHDERIVKDICTRALVLEHGKLILNTEDVASLQL